MSFSGSAASLLLDSIERIGASVGRLVEGKVAALRAAVRAEVRRAVSAAMWGVLAALLAFTALEFAAITILIAAWDTHRVLAAGLIAAGFLLLAFVALLAMRSNTSNKN
jgi:uncharacterized membrane protein YqjE